MNENKSANAPRSRRRAVAIGLLALALVFAVEGARVARGDRALLRLVEFP